jgi:hypothetical protein
VARFVREFDPAHERGWVAEIDGEIVGSVLLVKKSVQLPNYGCCSSSRTRAGMESAQARRRLRRFRARGRLPAITLWTQSTLAAARHLYEQAGFRLTHEEAHRSFGHDLVAQTWELALDRRLESRRN